jgi:hypothetical protein
MTNELAPIDLAQRPEFAALVEEVATTGKRRRFTRDNRDVAVLEPAESADTAIPADADAILAELARRRRQGMSFVAATAGILKPYATGPRGTIQETIRAEKDAFEQAVADEVMRRSEG